MKDDTFASGFDVKIVCIWNLMTHADEDAFMIEIYNLISRFSIFFPHLLCFFAGTLNASQMLFN